MAIWLLLFGKGVLQVWELSEALCCTDVIQFVSFLHMDAGMQNFKLAADIFFKGI